MVESLANELIQRADYLENRPIETIYFGGGTPSILTQVELKFLLDTIHNNFSLAEKVEISLEANPDDLNLDGLKAWREIGINRLSIGLQSFKASDLSWMNRAHTVEQARNCVQLAQEAGFENLTVDLIYGLPGLTQEEWKSHIQTVIDFGVPHVSAYCLTVEEKTALHKLVAAGKIATVSDDVQSDQFLLLLEVLEENGFLQYEISNFAKPGFESQHNGNYWKGEWYVGVGPSAHSFNGETRRWNVANNRRYLNAINAGESYFETEILSPENQFNERVMTGLRTTMGVNLSELEAIYSIPTAFYDKLNEFSKADWIQQREQIIYLSHEGRLRADHIASELFV
jgi:oxygen-independent coproporphyrinogen III oxidase